MRLHGKSLSRGLASATVPTAPARCHTVEDISPEARPWGLAVQLYGLRRPGDGGIGDTGAVAALADAAARLGADALALSPAHALFAADPHRYSPYAPSSRLFLNPLYADPATLFGNETVARAVNCTGLGAELGRLDAVGERVSVDAATAVATIVPMIALLTHPVEFRDWR